MYLTALVSSSCYYTIKFVTEICVAENYYTMTNANKFLIDSFDTIYSLFKKITYYLSKNLW